MIIYNVTVKIDLDVHDDWLQWMKTKHIPDVLFTGYFSAYRILKVLGSDESDGISYAIQYTCKDMATLQEYAAKVSPALQKEHMERYKDKFVSFRTLLEVVE